MSDIEATAAPRGDLGAQPAHSAQSRAMAELALVAESMNFKVTETRSAGRQLGACFRATDGSNLDVRFEPARDGTRYYHTGCGLGIWYDSSDSGDDDSPAWLESLLSAICQRLSSQAFAGLAEELAAQPAGTSESSAAGNTEAAAADASAAHGDGVGPSSISIRYVLLKVLKPYYDSYVVKLMKHYVPADARDADSVLIAMCGRNLPNVAPLRRFFRSARIFDATDVDLVEGRSAPARTSVFRADLRQPLANQRTYDFITVFKPPVGPLGSEIEKVFVNLSASLTPGGYLFIVLGEDDQSEYISTVLRQHGLKLVTAEPNAVPARLEREHLWIVIGQSPRQSNPPEPGHSD